MNRFSYFELATDNLEKTAAFYRDVFGWKVNKWDGPFEYWLVGNDDEGASGIYGGLMCADGGLAGTVNTIEVDDIDGAIARAQACGGEVVLAKHAITGIGYQAYIKDNAGIVLGLHHTDTNARE